MNQYTKEELKEALKVVTSSIRNCEKMHPKFAEGTSQHTLLKNRIKALYISKSLIEDENIKDFETYIAFIIFVSLVWVELPSSAFTCAFSHLLIIEDTGAMDFSKSLITNEINKRA